MAVSLVELGDKLEELEYYQQQPEIAEAAPPQPQAEWLWTQLARIDPGTA